MRGIYILPNLMTALNLSCGFWAVFLLATDAPDAVSKAPWLILFANVFDILDGRLARWTKGTSRFGAEFDSLADLVAFGVAPAVLLVKHALGELGFWGGVIALAYVLCGALRLARFNVQSGSSTESSYFFVGCPIPAAASLTASVVLYEFTYGATFPARFYGGLGVVTALLMVSNFPYPSLKKRKRDRKTRLVVKLAVLGGVVFALLTHPVGFIFTVAMCYFLSGILWKVGRMLYRLVPVRFRRGRDRVEVEGPTK